MSKVARWWDQRRRMWDRRRRARALRKINELRRFVDPLGEIRQFLYLDNIALRSLYVSRYGPEDARTTLTESRTSDDELSGNLGSSTAGFGVALRNSTAKTMQIERVASEQSLFRDFLDRELSAKSYSQIWDGTPDREGKINAEGRTFRRGDLIRVRIRLQADLTYRISSFASAISDLAEGAPEMNLPNAASTLQVAEVLRKLLIEQAPIDAELIDWRWDANSENLVRSSDSTEPLRLVGLTQIDNYWVDVRRALFDNAECTALVRVSEDIPSATWSPLKLFDAVRGIPGLDSLDEAINQIRASFNSVPNSPDTHQEPLIEALTHYGAERAPEEKADALRLHIEYVAAVHASSLPSASTLSTAFDSIDEFLKAIGVSPTDPNAMAEKRAAACAAANLSAEGAAPERSPQLSAPPSDRYIVGEIVALYW